MQDTGGCPESQPRPKAIAAVEWKMHILKRALARCLIAGFRVMACLPLRAARAVGTVIGALTWKLKTRSARITAINVAACFPHLSPAQRETLCRQSLIETGRLVGEMGFAWYGKPEAFARRVRIVEGAELLVRSAETGLLALMPHFGNWEILAYVFRQSRVTGLYAPPRIPGLDAETIRGRGRWGATMVPADLRGLREVKRTLKDGGLVGILPDQTPPPEAGVRAPIFGRQAITMTLVHRLLDDETRAIIATAQRTRHGFDVRMSLLDDRIRDPDVVVSATAMNAAIEAAVEREPAQYQWEYNRFRFALR